MPPLRKCLKHPGAYLALLGLLVAGTCADSFRLPDRQLSARTYIALVHGYQSLGRPVVAGVVQCRFRPTCSRYSIEAVQKYGLRKGLALTSARLLRCRGAVPLGPATRCSRWSPVSPSLRITLILKALPAKSSECVCRMVALEFGCRAILFALEPRFW